MNTSTRVRPPAVAGMFYPDDPQTLRSTIVRYLEAAAEDEAGLKPQPLKALIVPHAGYIYSGPVAAHAYARLIPQRNEIRRVILLGPAHRVAFRGLAAPSVDGFMTPLGRVPLDREAIEHLRELPFVIESDTPHAQEHSLEVQLPFLQVVLGDGFKLVPIVVGDASPEEVSRVLELFWDDPHTLILISSDLSHYLDYFSARELDRLTAEAIEHLEPEAIAYEQACGRIPIQGLLLEARRHGAHVKRLDLRNSGDTAGPREQVVGYGAWEVA